MKRVSNIIIYILIMAFTILAWYVLLSWMFGMVNAEASPYSEDEISLYREINDYREANGLIEIPFSPQLQRLASFHALELRQSRRLSHDFLDCDTDDNPSCMWDSIRRIGGSYPPPVFEIAASGVRSAIEAVESWSTSQQHNDVILNRGVWSDRPWLAMACGHDGAYAVCWFGERQDETPVDLTGVWYDPDNQGQGVQFRLDESTGRTEGVWYEEANGNVHWKVFTYRVDTFFRPNIVIIDPHLVKFDNLLLIPFQ